MADTTLTGANGELIKAYTSGGSSRHQSSVLAVSGADGAIRADLLRGITVDDVATQWTAGAPGLIQVIEDDATPERLNNGTSIPCKGVAVAHILANTGRLAFGSSNAVRAGDSSLNTPFYIDVGGPPMLIRVDDVNKVWAAVQTDGDSVIWGVLF